MLGTAVGYVTYGKQSSCNYSVALPTWYNQIKVMVTQIKYNDKPHTGATCAPSGYVFACGEV